MKAYYMHDDNERDDIYENIENEIQNVEQNLYAYTNFQT